MLAGEGGVNKIRSVMKKIEQNVNETME